MEGEMGLELRVEAGEHSVSAPIESPEVAALVARQLIDAGVTRVAVRETPPTAAGAPAAVGVPETPVFLWTEEKGGMAAEGSAMEAALSRADAFAAAGAEGGNVGDDILSVLQSADRWFDTNIMASDAGNALLEATPYGQIVKAAHETRMTVQYGESARARMEREETEREAAAARERERSQADREAAARARAVTREKRLAEREERSAEMDAATQAVIREAQGVTRAARRGDERALERLAALKQRAAQGDKEARRLFKIYNAVAQDDQDRIEAQLREAG